jgi:hypothetical protein
MREERNYVQRKKDFSIQLENYFRETNGVNLTEEKLL